MNTTTRHTDRSVRVAAAHVASPMLDRERCIAKACTWIERAADEGVGLVAFPESFVPGFPIWNALLRPIDGHRFFHRLADNALRTDGPQFDALRETARRCRVFVSLGFTEVSDVSPGCLWNSNALIGADGRLLNVHRKLVPTFYEKLTWNHGDAAGLRVVDTEIGRIGSLICGENGNPLSRYMLMAQAEEIHTANYPPVWPFRDPRGSGGYDLSEAIRVRSAAHAFEAKTYVVVSAGYLDEETMEVLCESDPERRAILEACPRSASMIVAPSGEALAGPWSDGETLISTDVDLAPLVELRQHHDMAGYYNRMDLIKVSVNRRRPRPLAWEEDDPSGGQSDAPTVQECWTEN